MNGVTNLDEMLECLWQLKERGSSTPAALREELGVRFKAEDLAQLMADGFVVREGAAIALSGPGAAHAQRLIRAHRIGERLIHDVMGRDFESGACEFEHILATEIVDGICTLLGHPRECPHGYPIPEGECCKVSARYAQQIIVPLTELKIGQTGRVAYVYTRNDQQMHRLNSLQIRPGTTVKLHQEYPSYVIECDGASIAMDAEVARNINVWIEGSAVVADPLAPGGTSGAARPTFTRPRWRWRIGGRSTP